MANGSPWMLLDPQGLPYEERLQQVVRPLVARVRREFPMLQDDAVVLALLESAAQRIAAREQRAGPITRVQGFAWVTVRNLARSWLRRPDARVFTRTVAGASGGSVLARTPTMYDAVAKIERAVLVQQVLSRLTVYERVVFQWKAAGYSSAEIAQRCRTSPGAIDTLLARARQRIRQQLSQPPVPHQRVAATRRSRVAQTYPGVATTRRDRSSTQTSC